MRDKSVKSLANKTTTSVPGKWFGNVIKSMGYATSDIVEELTPGIGGFMSENLEYAQELRESLKSAKENSKSIGELFNISAQVDIGKTAIKNTLSDLKTGKLYNKERIEEENAMDFDMDDYLDDDNMMGSSTIADKEKRSSTASEIQSQGIQMRHTYNQSTKATVNAIHGTNKTMANVANAMMSSNKNISQTTLMVRQKMHVEQMKGLESINQNIGLLVNFQNDSMAKYVAASVSYYEKQLEYAEQRAVPKSKPNEIKERDSDKLFSGMGDSFSLRGYADVVKSNYTTLRETSFVLNQIHSMFEDTDTLKYMAQSPLRFVIDTTTKKLIPGVLRSTMKQVDESFTAFFPALMSKITEAQTHNNPIVATLAKMFGLNDNVKSSTNYGIGKNEPAVIDKVFTRTVTDVIPTYLRQIASAVQGTEERMYDMETGNWSNASDMIKKMEDRIDAERTSGYRDTMSIIRAMEEKVNFGDERANKRFNEGITKFFRAMSGHSGRLNITDSEAVKNTYSFGNDDMDKVFFNMLQSLSNTDRMRLVGQQHFTTRKNINKYFTELEQNGDSSTRMLRTDKSINKGYKKDKSGNLERVIGKNHTGIGHITDKYGKTNLDYLKDITTIMLDGVKVINTGNNRGHGNDSVTPDSIQKIRQDMINKHTNYVRSQDEKRRRENSAVDDRNGHLNMSNGAYSNEGMRTIFKDALSEHENRSEARAEEERGKSLMDYANKYVLRGQSTQAQNIKSMVNEIVAKPAQILQGVFNRIDNTMHDIIFGEDSEGNSFLGSMQRTLNRQLHATLGFINEKVVNPIIDKIAGPDGLIDKFKGTGLYKSISSQISAIFKGGIAADGTKMEGLFGKQLEKSSSWIADASKQVVHMISGQGYTKSDGTNVPDNKDNMMNSVKRGIKSVYTDTKHHLFGDKNSNDPDRRNGALTRFSNIIGDGLKDWKHAMFGTKNPNETGSEVMKQLATETKSRLPNAMKYGFMGALGGSALSTASVGLLGMNLLPGGPLGMAMIGAAVGFANKSTSFSDWAFGERAGDGKRIGGAILKAHHMDFFKRNKGTIVGGAVSGVVGSTVLGSALSALPMGFLPAMLLPGGGIGSALVGIGLALTARSNTFQTLMFGPKGDDGKRVGGVLNSLFVKSTKRIRQEAMGKAKGTSLGRALVGGGGGFLAGSLLASSGVLGAFIGPAAPIGAALLGTAAGIALTSDRFQTFMFGKWNEKEGMREGGVFTKFGNWLNMELMQPMKDALLTSVVDTTYWLKSGIIAPLNFMMEPIVKLSKDATNLMIGMIKGTAKTAWNVTTFLPKVIGNVVKSGWSLVAKSINNSFEKHVGMPLSAVFTKFMFRPLMRLGKGILQGASAVGKGALTATMLPGMVLASGGMAKDTVADAGYYVKDKLTGREAKKQGHERKMTRTLDADGNVVGDGFMGDLKDAMSFRKMTDHVFDEESGRGNYMVNQYRRFGKQQKEYFSDWKTQRAKIKQNRQLRRDEQNSYALGGYGKLGKVNYRRMIEDKVKAGEFDNLGVSITEILGLDPEKYEKDQEEGKKLSHRQYKHLNSVLWRAKDSGKTGQALKDHLGLKERKVTPEERQAETNANIGRTVSSIEKIMKDKGFDIKKTDHKKILENVILSALIASQRGEGTKNTTTLRGNIGEGVRKVNAKIFNSVAEDKREWGSAGPTPVSRVSPGLANDSRLAGVDCGPKAVVTALSLLGINVSSSQVTARLGSDETHSSKGTSVMGLLKSIRSFGVKVEGKTFSVSSIKDAYLKGYRVGILYMPKYRMGHFVVVSDYDEGNSSVMVYDSEKTLSGRRLVRDLLRVAGTGARVYMVHKGQLNPVQSKSSITQKKTPTSGVIRGTSPSQRIGSTVASSSGSGVPMMSGGMSPSSIYGMLHDDKNPILVKVVGGLGDEGTEKTSTGGPQQSEAVSDIGGSHRNTVVGMAKHVMTALRFTSKMALGITKTIFKGLMFIPRKLFGGISKLLGRRKNNNNTDMGNAGQVQASKPTLKERFKAGPGARISSFFAEGPKGTAVKIGNSLVRAGNVATGTIGRLPAGTFSTSTTGVDSYNFSSGTTQNLDDKDQYNKRNNVSKYLADKAAEAKAAEESKFRVTTMDLLTRIEINTRLTAETLGDIFDLNKGFFDWMKRYLQNDLPNLFKELLNGIKDGLSGMDTGGGGGGSDANFKQKKTPLWMIKFRLWQIYRVLRKSHQTQEKILKESQSIARRVKRIYDELVKSRPLVLRAVRRLNHIAINTRLIERNTSVTNKKLDKILAAIKLCCKGKGKGGSLLPTTRGVLLPAPKMPKPIGLPAPNKPIGLPGPNPNAKGIPMSKPIQIQPPKGVMPGPHGTAYQIPGPNGGFMGNNQQVVLDAVKQIDGSYSTQQPKPVKPIPTSSNTNTPVILEHNPTQTKPNNSPVDNVKTPKPAYPVSESNLINREQMPQVYKNMYTNAPYGFDANSNYMRTVQQNHDRYMENWERTMRTSSPEELEKIRAQVRSEKPSLKQRVKTGVKNFKRGRRINQGVGNVSDPFSGMQVQEHLGDKVTKSKNKDQAQAIKDELRRRRQMDAHRIQAASQKEQGEKDKVSKFKGDVKSSDASLAKEYRKIQELRAKNKGELGFDNTQLTARQRMVTALYEKERGMTPQERDKAHREKYDTGLVVQNVDSKYGGSKTMTAAEKATATQQAKAADKKAEEDYLRRHNKTREEANKLDENENKERKKGQKEDKEIKSDERKNKKQRNILEEQKLKAEQAKLRREERENKKKEKKQEKKEKRKGWWNDYVSESGSNERKRKEREARERAAEEKAAKRKEAKGEKKPSFWNRYKENSRNQGIIGGSALGKTLGGAKGVREAAIKTYVGAMGAKNKVANKVSSVAGDAIRMGGQTMINTVEGAQRVGNATVQGAQNAGSFGRSMGSRVFNSRPMDAVRTVGGAVKGGAGKVAGAAGAVGEAAAPVAGAAKGAVKKGGGILGKLAGGVAKTAFRGTTIGGTGGLAAASYAAMDAAHGYQNADMILGKEAEELTDKDRQASATSAALVGTVPIIDTIDEIMGNKVKKFVAESILASAPIVDGAKKLWTDLNENTEETLMKLKDQAVEKLGEMKDKVVPALKWLGEKAWTITKAMGKLGVKIFNVMKEKTIEKMGELKEKAIEKANEMKEKAVEKLKEMVKNTVEKFKSLAKNVGNKAKELVKSIVDPIAKLPGTVKDSLGNLAGKVKKKLTEFGSAIVDKITNLAPDWVPFIGGKGTGVTTRGVYGSGDNFQYGSINPSDNKDGLFLESYKKRRESISNFNKEFDAVYGAGDTCPDCHGPNCSCKTNTGKDVYYSQNDTRWSNKTVNGKLKMNKGGCGPTAASMVVSSITGREQTPDQANEFANQHGLTDEEKGTSSNLFASYGAANGVPIMETHTNPVSLQSQLKAGNKVILRGQGGKNYTSGGHYVVATGLTGDGKVKVHDPISRGRSGKFSPDQILDGATNTYVAGSPDSILRGVTKEKQYAMGDGKDLVKQSRQRQAKLIANMATYGTGVSGVDFVRTAMKSLRLPYIWGGASLTRGADCSGLVSSVTTKVLGYNPWGGRTTAHEQMIRGKLTDVPISQAAVGDIIFFKNSYSHGYNKNTYATHVAFISGDNEMIGASGDTSTGSIRFDVISPHYWWQRVLKVRRVNGVAPGPKVVLNGKIGWRNSYYSPANPKLTGGTGERPSSASGSKSTAASNVSKAVSTAATVAKEATLKFGKVGLQEAMGVLPKAMENLMSNHYLGSENDIVSNTVLNNIEGAKDYISKHLTVPKKAVTDKVEPKIQDITTDTKGNTTITEVKKGEPQTVESGAGRGVYGAGDVCPDCHGPNCTCGETTGSGNNDVYYSQKDSRWANKKLKGKLNVGKGGCGPTAASMVVSSLTGNKVTPDEASDFANANGMTDEERGTSSELFPAFMGSRGIPVAEDAPTGNSLVGQLKAGNKVILRGQGGKNYTSGGHYVVATGLTPDGKVKVNDPISKGRSGKFDVGQVMDGVTNSYVAGKSTSSIAHGMGIGNKLSNMSSADTMVSAMNSYGTGVTGVDFVTTAMKSLGLPYVWGGESLTAGADCSGFVSSVTTKVLGYNPWGGRTDAHNQMTKGKLTDVPFDQVAVGDILFFKDTYPHGYNRNTYATHVVFISGDNEMIGASGNNTTGSIQFDVLYPDYFKKVLKVRRVNGVAPGPKVKFDGTAKYRKPYYKPANPTLTGGDGAAPDGNSSSGSTGGTTLVSQIVNGKTSFQDALGAFPKMLENIMSNHYLGTEFDTEAGTIFQKKEVSNPEGSESSSESKDGTSGIGTVGLDHMVPTNAREELLKKVAQITIHNETGGKIDTAKNDQSVDGEGRGVTISPSIGIIQARYSDAKNLVDKLVAVKPERPHAKEMQSHNWNSQTAWGQAKLNRLREFLAYDPVSSKRVQEEEGVRLLDKKTIQPALDNMKPKTKNMSNLALIADFRNTGPHVPPNFEKLYNASLNPKDTFSGFYSQFTAPGMSFWGRNPMYTNRLAYNKKQLENWKPKFAFGEGVYGAGDVGVQDENKPETIKRMLPNGMPITSRNMVDYFKKTKDKETISLIDKDLHGGKMTNVNKSVQMYDKLQANRKRAQESFKKRQTKINEERAREKLMAEIEAGSKTAPTIKPPLLTLRAPSMSKSVKYTHETGNKPIDKAMVAANTPKPTFMPSLATLLGVDKLIDNIAQVKFATDTASQTITVDASDEKSLAALKDMINLLGDVANNTAKLSDNNGNTNVTNIDYSDNKSTLVNTTAVSSNGNRQQTQEVHESDDSTTDDLERLLQVLSIRK